MTLQGTVGRFYGWTGHYRFYRYVCNGLCMYFHTYLHVRVNMPVLFKFDVRPAFRAWFINADRSSRQTVAKATM